MCTLHSQARIRLQFSILNLFAEPHELRFRSFVLHVRVWNPEKLLRSAICQFSILDFFRSPMNLLPSAIHVSSTTDSGAPRIYCLAMFANSPFSTFIRSPMNILPSAVHASSTHESGSPRIYCLALFANSPFSTFFGDP